MRWEKYKQLTAVQRAYFKSKISDDISFMLFFVAVNILFLSCYVIFGILLLGGGSQYEVLKLIKTLTMFFALSWLSPIIVISYNLIRELGMLRKWGIK